MNNQQIARILHETAALLELDGAIIGRYRSYEKAADLIGGLPESVEQLVKTPEKLKELPGIGDRMASVAIERTTTTRKPAANAQILRPTLFCGTSVIG